MDSTSSSAETSAKISAANKGRTPSNKGVRSSDETRAKIRAARARQVIKHSPEARQRMSEAAKRRYARQALEPTYDHATDDADLAKSAKVDAG